MKNVLILGAGRFGTRAAGILTNRGYHVTLVDREEPLLKTGNFIAFDAVSFLHDPHVARRYDWIVPAVPVHVAFEWLCGMVRSTGRRFCKQDVPEGILPGLALYRSHGTLYISMENHTCPADCPEPVGLCYLTGLTREKTLYDLICEIELPDYTTNVIRSIQLAPGVGGILPKNLDALYTAVTEGKKQGIVATSCSCHAVINAYCL